MNASPSTPIVGRHILVDDHGEIAGLERELLSALDRKQYDQTSAFAVRLALQEALANAFKHGNRGEPGKKVIVDYRVDADEVTLELQDQGEGFVPESVPDPTASENVTIPSGRGIMLMRSFMTSVEYFPPGNRVRMKYVKPT